MLYFSIKCWRRAQRRTDINFKKPRFEPIINQYIEPINLKSTISLILMPIFGCHHIALSCDTSFHNNILNLFFNLTINIHKVHLQSWSHYSSNTQTAYVMTIWKFAPHCFLSEFYSSCNFWIFCWCWSLLGGRIFLRDSFLSRVPWQTLRDHSRKGKL